MSKERQFLEKKTEDFMRHHSSQGEHPQGHNRFDEFKHKTGNVHDFLAELNYFDGASPIAPLLQGSLQTGSTGHFLRGLGHKKKKSPKKHFDLSRAEKVRTGGKKTKKSKK